MSDEFQRKGKKVVRSSLRDMDVGQKSLPGQGPEAFCVSRCVTGCFFQGTTPAVTKSLCVDKNIRVCLSFSSVEAKP
jgi:hypothetical protein